MQDKKGQRTKRFVGRVEHNTRKAVLFKAYEWEEAMWLPRSVISLSLDWIPDEATREATVDVAEWLCDKNGLREGEERKANQNAQS